MKQDKQKIQRQKHSIDSVVQKILKLRTERNRTNNNEN